MTQMMEQYVQKEKSLEASEARAAYLEQERKKW